jgi:hypothetical protein
MFSALTTTMNLIFLWLFTRSLVCMFLGYYLNYLPSYTSVGSEFKMYSKMNLIKKNLFLNGGNENNRTYDVCHHNLDCTIFVLRCFPPLLFSNMILKSCFLAMLMFTMLPFLFYAVPKAIKLFPRGSIR